MSCTRRSFGFLSKSNISFDHLSFRACSYARVKFTTEQNSIQNGVEGEVPLLFTRSPVVVVVVGVKVEVVVVAATHRPPSLARNAFLYPPLLHLLPVVGVAFHNVVLLQVDVVAFGRVVLALREILPDFSF